MKPTCSFDDCEQEAVSAFPMFGDGVMLCGFKADAKWPWKAGDDVPLTGEMRPVTSTGKGDRTTCDGWCYACDDHVADM